MLLDLGLSRPAWMRPARIARFAVYTGFAVMTWACGNDGGDPGRVDTTTTQGTAQPTSFTATQTTGTGSDTEGSSTTTTEGSTGGTDDGGTGSPVCPATHVCVPEAPTDWMGPVARATSLVAGAIEPECPASYPETDAEVFAGVMADPASCSCSCGAATGAICETGATMRFYDDSADCSDVPATIQLFAGVCNSLPSTFGGNSYWTVDPIESIGGACEPTASVAMDEAAFETRLVACGSPELLDGCAEGNVCAPSPPGDFAAGLCVWRDGEHTCPSSYPQEHAFFREVDDQRGCQPCTCGEARGLCDNALVRLYQSGCVAPIAGAFSPNGECVQQTPVTASFGSVTLNDPTAFCTPSTGSATGEALGRDPVTICCDE